MSVSFAVVIPAYNRAALLSMTLDSILGQDLPPAEVIVVDDGSRDGTAQVVERYGDRVHLIRTSNVGAPGARHTGVLASRSEWIAFCDSDDLWRPHHLARLSQAAELTAAPFVFSNFVLVRDGVWDSEDKFSAAPPGYWSEIRKITPEVGLAQGCMLPRLLEYQPVFTSCLAVRRDFYDEIGGYDPGFGRHGSEDLEFVLRAVMKGSPAVVFAPTVGIRRHSGNFSADLAKILVGELDILCHFSRTQDLTAEHRQLVDARIGRLAIESIDASFVAGRFDDVKALASRIPNDARTLRRRIKIAVAGLPASLARPLARMLTRGPGPLLARAPRGLP